MYIIRDRQTGTEIEECATMEEAKTTLEAYENEDKADGAFEPDFYEIVEG